MDQIDSDIVAVTRHRPTTHESVILVAFTAFSHPSNNEHRHIKPLIVEGVLDEIILEASLSHVNVKTNSAKYDRPKNFLKNDTHINGLSEYELEINEHFDLEESTILSAGQSDEHKTQLNFTNFKPGSVVAIK